jgi:hypothetical protein
VQSVDNASYVDDDWSKWNGTQIGDFLNASISNQQTISKIELGGFRYVTIPKTLAETNLGTIIWSYYLSKT